MTPPPAPAPVPRSAGRRFLRRFLGALLVLGLSTVLIGSAFFRPSLEGGFHVVQRFPLGSWFRDLPEHLPWLAAFILLSSAMIPLRAFRWGFTLGAQKGPFWSRYHSVAIGLFANNVIPAKLGEGFRALVFTRATGMPFFQSLGTVLVCKLLDIFALLILVLGSPGGPLLGGGGFSGGLLGAGIAVPVLALLLVLLGRHGPGLSEALRRRGRAAKLQSTLTHLSAGLRANSWRSLGKALLGTLAAVSTVATAYFVALRGAGVDVAWTGGVLLLAAVTFGQSPPGVPAGLGVYYLASSWAARLLGATEAEAATLAVLTHLGTAFTHVSVGAVSAIIRRDLVRGLWRRRTPGGGPPARDLGGRQPAESTA